MVLCNCCGKREAVNPQSDFPGCAVCYRLVDQVADYKRREGTDQDQLGMERWT